MRLKLVCVAASIVGAAFTPAAAAQGDGIFTPRVEQLATPEQTGWPVSSELPDLEPAFTAVAKAGQHTGDKFVIDLPDHPAGGECILTGNERYALRAGVLEFDIIAKCGELRRGYVYSICRINAQLLCAEPPWWYFRNERYVLSNRGIEVNGALVAQWADRPHSVAKLAAAVQQIADKNARLEADIGGNRSHARIVTCREYNLDKGGYMMHGLPTQCAIGAACSGLPDFSSQKDGVAIDWNSAIGLFVRRNAPNADPTHWQCWLRTQ